MGSVERWSLSLEPAWAKGKYGAHGLVRRGEAGMLACMGDFTMSTSLVRHARRYNISRAEHPRASVSRHAEHFSECVVYNFIYMLDLGMSTYKYGIYSEVFTCRALFRWQH